MKQQLVKDENKVQALRLTFQTLQEQMKTTQSMTTGSSNEINELITEKENLQREKEALDKQKTLLDSEFEKVKEKIDSETNAKNELEELLKGLKIALSQTEEKIQRDEEKKRKQQQELERLKNEKEI
jgi:chromosome segregation ATPase